MFSGSAVDALVRFARHAAEARSSEEILPLLAHALVQQVHADAVAVLEIRPDGTTRFVPSPHHPPALGTLTVEADEIDDTLGNRLLAACEGRYSVARARPLVSGGGLYGAVFLFFEKGHSSDQETLGDAFVDFAAITIGSVAKVHQLARTNAELRASQETLARTEKLRALGQMAAGVSHDLKNILNPISLHLQFVQRASDRGDSKGVKESVSEIKQVLARGVQTIELLRDYGRQERERKVESLELDALVREAIAIATPRMAARGGRKNPIVEELDGPPHVNGQSGEIVGALVNLLINAIDAMPDGGKITVRSGSDREHVWLEVADEGPGMPPDIAKRVFEPFFTTKGSEGTGLGLGMVYACMKRHGGWVKLDTAVGQGTTFRLVFPRTPSAPPPSAAV